MDRRDEREPNRGNAARAPYDAVRGARRGELGHRDHGRLHDLLDDYFAHADDLELIARPTPRRAA